MFFLTVFSMLNDGFYNIKRARLSLRKATFDKARGGKRHPKRPFTACRRAVNGLAVSCSNDFHRHSSSDVLASIHAMLLAFCHIETVHTQRRSANVRHFTFDVK